MVILRDIQWESGHLVQKQGLRYVILLEGQIGRDKEISGYLH